MSVLQTNIYNPSRPLPDSFHINLIDFSDKILGKLNVVDRGFEEHR